MIYRNVYKHIHRSRALSSSRRTPSSDEIRKTFLDFFIQENEHKFIRSSPVVPFCDPTVAFVNAGMNQFKSVFLGRIQPPASRVANSQKCVRVGGKHNDLSVVGKDGYHHTFFEMLGNWSFGNYFKREACEMAWNLIRGPFGIDPSRLYVTYFGGDNLLRLSPDIECREIWRSLGVPDDRILPFGSSANFWEMGATGPCGPCTEIHIDHLPNSQPAIRAKYVNADREDLTELWNLVFIEYNRNADGSIISLPEKHIDTGMGMERLTALLQGKSTNYETDLFMPLFDIIQKVTNLPSYCNEFSLNSDKYSLYTAYRILGDHSRMITACLADGMLPDQNHKLRRIIRKSLLLSENVFRKNNLLNEVIPKVVDILGPTYPEMQIKLSDVLEIISHENEMFTALRKTCAKDIYEILSVNKKLEDIDLFDSPGFVPAYKDLQCMKGKFTNQVMPGDFIFKLRDTYGLDEEAIEKLADIEELKMDRDGYLVEIAKAKDRTKGTFYSAGLFDSTSQAVTNFTSNLNDTIDYYKYNYSYNKSTKKYEVQPVKTKVIGLMQNGKVVQSIRGDSNDAFSIITEKSNFYYESGGQQSDCGSIVKVANNGNNHFDVKTVDFVNGCVIHSGNFNKVNCNFEINFNDDVQLVVDQIRRTKNILHHSATHLLNASIRNIYKSVTYQVSSSVTSNCLKLELGVLGNKILKGDIANVEALIRNAIKNDLPMNVKKISAHDVLNTKDIVMVPGEIYPETGLRLLTMIDSSTGLSSKELCCGTHVLKTGELEEFSITNFKPTGRSKYLFVAVAGDVAIQIRKQGEQMISTIANIEDTMHAGIQKIDALEIRLQKLRNEIVTTEIDLPYLIKLECLDRISKLLKSLRDTSRTTVKEFIQIEMGNILQQNPIEKSPYIVHFLDCSSLMEDISLQKATKLCTDRPILVVSLTDKMIKARCCVPKDKITNNFSAQEWLEKLAVVFNAQVSPPKGQDPKAVCNMKAKKIHSAIFDEQLELAMRQANEFAIDRL